MRLVLDTNVWLDWLVFGNPEIAPLRAAVAEGRAEVLIDDACEEELVRVLAYPLQHWTLDAAARETCLAQCRNIARRIAPACSAILPRCADPDDQKFLELAAGAGADWLVTRDRALLDLARHHATLTFHIVTPAQFATLTA